MDLLSFALGDLFGKLDGGQEDLALNGLFNDDCDRINAMLGAIEIEDN